jgi:hypothetical protein
MAFSDSDDEDRLEKLFAGVPLDNIVWREKVSNLGLTAGQLTFDLRVFAPKRALRIDTDSRIGVAYWPSGPVLKGSQLILEGQTIVFRNLLVKAGAEIIVAMEDEWPVEVSAERTGYIPPPPDTKPSVELPTPGAGLGVGIGFGLGAALILAGIYFFGSD